MYINYIINLKSGQWQVTKFKIVCIPKPSAKGARGLGSPGQLEDIVIS